MYRSLILLQIFAGACLAAEPLPPAAQILDRYIQVTGGVAAYDKSKFVTLSGTVNANGATGSFDSYAAAPGLKYQVINFGNGAMEEGTDGVVAWQRAPSTGARLKPGLEKTLALRSAKLHKEAHWRDYYSSAETLALEDCTGSPCYKLILTHMEGPKETHFYDKASGLIRRVTTMRSTPQGEVAIETAFDDFRFEGALKMPHRLTTHAPNLELRVDIEDADTATPIDAEKFELPADVKALLKLRKPADLDAR